MAPAATGMTPAATGVASARKSRGMFVAAVMTSITCMAMTVLRLVSMEMVERLLALYRIRSVVAVARIVAVVDMPIKSVRPVKPGAGSDEHPSEKPIRPVITVGRTLVRSIVEIAIGTNRWCSMLTATCAGAPENALSMAAASAEKAKNFKGCIESSPTPSG